MPPPSGLSNPGLNLCFLNVIVHLGSLSGWMMMRTRQFSIKNECKCNQRSLIRDLQAEMSPDRDRCMLAARFLDLLPRFCEACALQYGWWIAGLWLHPEFAKGCCDRAMLDALAYQMCRGVAALSRDGWPVVPGDQHCVAEVLLSIFSRAPQVRSDFEQVLRETSICNSCFKEYPKDVLSYIYEVDAQDGQSTSLVQIIARQALAELSGARTRTGDAQSTRDEPAYCDHCDTTATRRKKTVALALPSRMLFQIRRFRQAPERRGRGGRSPNTTTVTLPWTLKSWELQGKGPPEGPQRASTRRGGSWLLEAVIEFLGQSGTGHYTIKLRKPDGRWYELNDASVAVLPRFGTSGSGYTSLNTYIALYTNEKDVEEITVRARTGTELEEGRASTDLDLSMVLKLFPWLQATSRVRKRIISYHPKCKPEIATPRYLGLFSSRRVLYVFLPVGFPFPTNKQAA